jgi:hypothetical protein
VNSSKNSKKEIGIGGEAETLTFYDGQFTTHKTDGWTILDDLTEPKTDFEGGMTYETHSDITRDNMETMVSGFEETDGRFVTTAAGHECVSYEIRGAVGGTDIVYLHVTVETEDHIHQILQWSLPEKYKKKLEDYSAVWKSLKPKNAVRQPSESGA